MVQMNVQEKENIGLAEFRQDGRQHRRIKTNLLGRYMLSDRREYPCTVVDVALGGVALTGPVRGTVGEPVIVYIDQLGRVQGDVVRFIPNGFALKLRVTTRATMRFAERIMELQARSTLQPVPERRSEPRVEPDDEAGRFQLPDGTECEVVNLSLTGADLYTLARPPVGTLVQLGRIQGKVVRHSESGVAISFLNVPDNVTLTETLAEVMLPRSR